MSSAGTGRGNPPGQPALRYRTGTWASFRASLLERLTRQTVPPGAAGDAPRPLATLTTRAPDDPTIALLDSFAALCDVLTFYSERILNEGYLGTATEERSVTEIARGIGYEPAPGVAATTALAFTVDPNRGRELEIPAGLPVMSVPGEEGELPVTFETAEDLEARAEWNLLPARTTRPQVIQRDTRELRLAGVDTRLRPGDPLVVVGRTRMEDENATDTSERWDLRFVTAVTPAADGGTTVVTLDRGLGDPYTAPASEDVRVVAFRERGGLFGWNAPDVRMMSEDVRNNSDLVSGSQWRDFSTLASDRTRVVYPRAVDLDREYPAVVAGGWVVLQSATEVELYRVTQANPTTRTEFSLSSRVTRVFVDSTEHLDDFNRRGTTVLLGSEELALAEEPDPDPVSGFQVTLVRDPATPPMPPGRMVLVSGEAADSGTPTVVRTTVAAWTDGGPYAVVELADALPPLRRDSVRVHGNVVLATHGATVAEEVLGSGDASSAHQQFRLGHQPLTYVPGSPTGARSTLEVRVGGVLWERVPSLFGTGPSDRVYRERREHDGSTTITFGDGVRGARLPSGVENVRATYRKGLGLAGQVDAGRLALLQRRPPGLRAVVNPQPAEGAADPDALEEIRRLAPLTVLTLGRLVSLQDYEDFAASFPGIGKALATRLWDGRRGFVHLTVAGATGAVLEEEHTTMATLRDAITEIADPDHDVVLAGHDEVPFGLTMNVLVDPAYLVEDIFAAVRAALLEAFSFARRSFGQAVTSAEIVAVAHTVPGVVAIDVDALERLDPGAGGGTDEETGFLGAAKPSWDGTQARRAELLVLDPDAVELHEMDDT